MSITSQPARPRPKYHPQAYQFVFDALRVAQERVKKIDVAEADEESAHITGPELLEGVRLLAIEQFGLMTRCVFRSWGLKSTLDFGRIVFELVNSGGMRKTERDRIEDFMDIYDFDEVFDRQYDFDLKSAFRR